MAAMTGQERGLPVGSYLNDTVEAGPDVAQVSVVWQPYDDKVNERRQTFRLTFKFYCLHNAGWWLKFFFVVSTNVASESSPSGLLASLLLPTLDVSLDRA